MGGATITKTGATPDEVLDLIREQLKTAYVMGLEADSDLALINPDNNIGKVYGVVYEAEGKVTFVEQVAGKVDMAIAVGAAFGPKPTKAKPWVGCVHVHT